MKHIEWSEDKNNKLKLERGICFEDIQTLIEDDKVLADISHPNKIRYKNQRIFIIEVDSYAYLVPYVEDETKIFLKTIVPNRKATKKYVEES